MAPLDVSKQFGDAVEGLRSRLRGSALQPDDAGYDDARAVWNAMIDRRPAIIVRPRGAADVMAAIRFSREHGLEVALKGGGHNVAGNGTCEGGLMVDFADMTSVRVDPGRRIAWVEPGARLADVDRETQAHGLATPGGFISSTGVAGLTLGGGFGYLSRNYGLTIDNLRSVDLVTADGAFVRADAETQRELFWALRGGGGNFGAVTAFEFDLHSVGPEVLAGPIVHDFADAPDVLRQISTAMQEAPDEVSCLIAIRHAPPAPFIPASHHGRLVLLLAPIYTGDLAAGEAALAPLRSIGSPLADAIGPRLYTAFQSMFDKAAADGARNYWKGHYLADLGGETADVICHHAAQMPSKESTVGFLSLGGQIARHDVASTAYAHRKAAWVLNIQSRWRDPDEDAHQTTWAREFFDAIAPFATGGVYVNLISADEGAERTRAAYDEATFRRLAAVKAQWDPGNIFHRNQNILPAGAAV